MSDAPGRRAGRAVETEAAMHPPASGKPSVWPEGSFDGPREFAERVREILAGAAAQGWREMVFADPDFVDWPLGERALVQALQDWGARGRTLRLVAKHFRAFERTHARFVHWRRGWDHIVQCRAFSAGDVPSALWTPQGYLHRIDPLRSRGVCGVDAARRVALRHDLDECFHNGVPAFAATVLGL